MSIVEVVLEPGEGVTDRARAGDDTTVHVVDGIVDVQLGHAVVTLGAGGCLFAPRGARLGLANPGPRPARLLLVSSPAVDGGHTFAELAAGRDAGRGHAPAR